MKQLTHDISMQFYNGERGIALEPNVTKAMRTEAALLCQNKFKSSKAKNSTEEKKVFLVPSSQLDGNIANEAHYRCLVKRQWLSFDEYVVDITNFTLCKFVSTLYSLSQLVHVYVPSRKTFANI